MTSKAGRRGGRGHCATCDHPQAAAIDRALVRQVALRSLATKYGISASSLNDHRLHHLNPALKAVRTEQREQGVRTVLEQVRELVADMQAVMKEAFKKKNVAQVIAGNRELRQNLELLAKLTGELDERPDVVVNIVTTADWIAIRTMLLKVLIPYPEAMRVVADGLAALKVAA